MLRTANVTHSYFGETFLFQRNSEWGERQAQRRQMSEGDSQMDL